MFQCRLFDGRLDEEVSVVDIIAIRSINYNKETGLYLISSTIEEIITKFVLNAILHRAGLS